MCEIIRIHPLITDTNRHTDKYAIRWESMDKQTNKQTLPSLLSPYFVVVKKGLFTKADFGGITACIE